MTEEGSSICSPPWLAEVCTAFACEVKEALASQSQPSGAVRQENLMCQGNA